MKKITGLLTTAALLLSFMACRKQLQEKPVSPNDKPAATFSKHGRGTVEKGVPPTDAELSAFKVSVSRPQGGMAQRNINNKLGMWLWYLEGTGYTTHAALADKLVSLGVKRIYVKVADGGYSPTSWPEVDNAALVSTYKSKGIEVWAWSYNYPGNEANQAKALTQAAKAGYQGYVTDIEIEFDRTSTTLENMMLAFSNARAQAITAGYTTSAFKLYCTTWGNPKDHGMRVDIIDKYVDGHMPQTYVEVWGSSYMANAAQWVNAGTQEYRDLGARKPIHHIVSDEQNVITATQINSFINASGGETSIWRIPGGGTSLNIWTSLAGVNWTADFGTTSGALTLNVPGFIQTGAPAVFTGTATGTITSVRAFADGFAMGNAVNVVNGMYTINYTFNTAGANRALVVRGYNAAGTEVTSVSRTITVNPSSGFLTVTIPNDIRTTIKARFAGNNSSDISKVKVYADNFYLGDAVMNSGSWSFEYTFNTAGVNRVLRLEGYNTANALVKTTTANFTVTQFAAYVTGVPYFYQYSNSYNPSGSCQNTSIAMILKYYAIKQGLSAANAITPDDISNYWGTDKAQTVAGFVDLFNREAAFRGITIRDDGSEVSTLTKMRDQLAQGKPVVVHDYMTSYGHVVVVLGFDGTYYYCNDPAGKWNQVYMGGGYSQTNPTEGIAVKYSKAAFEQAVSPDGVVWLHRFY